VLGGSRVKELYKEYCWDRPLVPAIERLKDRVLANCTYSTTMVERKIEQEVDKVLVTRDPLRLYKDMFKDPELVRKLAEGEQVPDDLAAICGLTLKSLRSKKIRHEDLAPILLIKRLVDGEPRYANIKHLIIDEAQDYTPVHYEIIRNLFGGSSVTILGDLSQRVNAYSGLDNYDALRQFFGKDAQGVLRLTKSYRSTQEITDFAHSMLLDAEAAQNIRSTGRKPAVVRVEDQEQLAGLISAEMDKLKANGFASIAVICKTAAEAMGVYSKLLPTHDVRLVESGSITFHHGLVVLPAYLAKGLEFDAVIMHDAGAHVYGSDSERTLLYTACTRALHSLTVYFTGEPSPLLPLDRPELFEFRANHA
jgi:DNA helicase II / ATP-dependent DNA helicase PcrA